MSLFHGNCGTEQCENRITSDDWSAEYCDTCYNIRTATASVDPVATATATATVARPMTKREKKRATATAASAPVVPVAPVSATVVPVAPISATVVPVVPVAPVSAPVVPVGLFEDDDDATVERLFKRLQAKKQDSVQVLQSFDDRIEQLRTELAEKQADLAELEEQREQASVYDHKLSHQLSTMQSFLAPQDDSVGAAAAPAVVAPTARKSAAAASASAPCVSFAAVAQVFCPDDEPTPSQAASDGYKLVKVKQGKRSAAAAADVDLKAQVLLLFMGHLNCAFDGTDFCSTTFAYLMAVLIAQCRGISFKTSQCFYPECKTKASHSQLPMYVETIMRHPRQIQRKILLLEYFIEVIRTKDLVKLSAVITNGHCERSEHWAKIWVSNAEKCIAALSSQ